MENRPNLKPFIKKLKTDHFFYIYDVNSNDLFRVDSIIYDLIDYIGETDVDSLVEHFKHIYAPEAIREKYDQISNARDEQGYFSTHRPEIFCGYRSIDDLKYVYRSNLNQLVLELTENCNLRCDYCVFSGTYQHSRGHGEKEMSKETAIKAVDFFISMSRKPGDGPPPAITFYGGEPLLKIDLITAVAEYIKSKGLAGQYKFSFTTNGTLLTEALVRRLVEHDISIVISLDGPGQLHDRYRKFENGKGTFDAIIKNLKRIKETYPEYFKKNIAFASIAAPPYDFNSITRFFYRDKFLEPLREKLILNFIDSFDTTFFKDYCLEGEREKLKPELRKLKWRYLEALITGTYEELTIEKQLFLKDFHALACRQIAKLERQVPALGACIPGQRRLYVDTIGDFFMCERVGSHYSIGNVKQGLDYEKILGFYARYDRFFENCSNCWALRICRKCFNDIRKGGEFDEKRREQLCRAQLEDIEENLALYARALEINNDAFLIFNDISVV